MKTTKEINLRDFNNAEYVAFMAGLRALITKATPEKLHIDADTLTAFDADLTQFSDILVRLQGRDDTRRLAELDNDRDRLLSYVLASIRYASRLPLANLSEAATRLGLLMSPYKNIARLPGLQEAEVIEAILLDFAKPGYTTDVSTLGLADAVAELKAANDEYKSLIIGRTESLAADPMEYSKEIRQKIDKHYSRIRSLAEAVLLLDPSPEASDFVKELNQLIAEREGLYKLRMARPKDGQTPEPGSPS